MVVEESLGLRRRWDVYVGKKGEHEGKLIRKETEGAPRRRLFRSSLSKNNTGEGRSAGLSIGGKRQRPETARPQTAFSFRGRSFS